MEHTGPSAHGRRPGMLINSAQAAGTRHYSLCSIGHAGNHVNASWAYNKKPAVLPAGLQMRHSAVCHASRIHQLSKRSSAFAHRRRAFDVTRPMRRRAKLLFPTRGLRICLPSSLPIFRSPLLTGTSCRVDFTSFLLPRWKPQNSTAALLGPW